MRRLGCSLTCLVLLCIAFPQSALAVNPRQIFDESPPLGPQRAPVTPGTCIYYEDFQQGKAGWVVKDFTFVPEIYWRQTAYGGTDGVMWCGTDAPEVPNYLTPPGYGNLWYQVITKSFALPASSPTLDYSIQYDTEAGYDFVYVQVSTDGGNTYSDLRVLDGQSTGFEPYSEDLTSYAGQLVTFRFKFESDSAVSDEDGGAGYFSFDSDGACRLDWVEVTGFVRDNFTAGDDGWTASVPTPNTPFRIDVTPPCSASLPCPAYCNSWVAYDPQTGVFPFERSEEPWSTRAFAPGIESPAITIPSDGTSYTLEFDVYHDLPLDNLVFFSWSVAAPPPEDGGQWRDYNFVYWDQIYAGFATRVFDITPLITPGATEIKIRLAAYDGYANWGGIFGSGTTHTAAPMFDNVAIVVAGTAAAGIDCSNLPGPCDPSYTVEGQNVAVSPVDPTTGTTPVTITFDEVTAEGLTTVTTSDTGADPPAGFQLGDPATYYDLQTTAQHTGNIEVCIDYSGVSYSDESSLKLLHYEDGAWVDVTSSLDTGADIICGIVSSLSLFVAVEQTGSVAGTVLADCPAAGTPLLGVTVDVYRTGTGDLVTSGATVEDGSYTIDSLPGGNYAVTLVTPMGYNALSEEVAVTVLGGQTATADFPVSCQAIAADPRSMGFWKHQVGVATGGNGNAQIGAEPLCAYLDLIEKHFNSNAVNQVIVYVPPASGECADKLLVAKDLLNLKGSVEMAERAKQHFMALLLNVAAEYVGLAEIVSDDGATLSQAITYCDLLLDDTDADNDEIAKDISADINNGTLIAAGVIPLGTLDIAYSPPASRDIIPTRLAIKSVFPNPFNPQTVITYTVPDPGFVSLRIYDIRGRLVRELVAKEQAAGEHTVAWQAENDRGSSIASGVYIARLGSRGKVEFRKIVFLK